MTGPLGLLAFPRRRVLYRLIWEPSLQQVGRSVRASFGNKIATTIELLNAVIPDIHDINALITKSQSSVTAYAEPPRTFIRNVPTGGTPRSTRTPWVVASATAAPKWGVSASSLCADKQPRQDHFQ